MSNDYVTVEVKGLDQLQAALEQQTEKMQKRGLRAALRAGGAVIRAAMVSRAPKDTGLLSEHFDVKTRLIRNELAGSAFIGPNGKEIIHPQGKGKTAGIPRTARFIAALLEFGTTRMGKKPFMTQAYETTKQEAVDAVAKQLKDSLDL